MIFQFQLILVSVLHALITEGARNVAYNASSVLPKGVVSMDLQGRVGQSVLKKRRVLDTGSTLLTRAQQEFAARLDNQRFYYSAVVQIGTPPQDVELLVDTGSSDTWVFSPYSAHKGRKPKPKSLFDPTKSKTFKANGTSYKIQYGIGSSTGQWGTDVFKMGSVSVKDLSIGIADTGDVSQGIVGIGRPAAEVTYKTGIFYDNLPLKLRSSGLIHTAAYSLYLNDLNAKSGTILFGGIDHSKYTGPLYALPITHPKHMGIQIKSMKTDGIERQNFLKKKIKTVVLDSGTSLTYLPAASLDDLHTYLNANPSFAIGEKYYCDCNVTKHIDMDFGGVKIKVPNHFFLWPIEAIVNPVISTAAFPPNSCYISIEKTQRGMDFILLGDNFLRAMYAIYDIDHSHIAIAQANLQGGTPQIEPIIDTIPGALYG